MSNNEERMKKGFLDYFVGQKFGQPSFQRFPTREEVERYCGKLPDFLLWVWQEQGFSGYLDGKFWLVNPADYDDILDRFLEPTPFIEQDVFHVIARDAWGELYIWGEKTGNALMLSSALQWLRTRGGDEVDIANGEADRAIKWFLTMSCDPDDMDMEDEQEQPLFERAKAKLGPLAEDEMYGFAPFLFMGGPDRLENVHKVNIQVHLNLIADMGELEIIDMASMVRGTLQRYEEK